MMSSAYLELAAQLYNLVLPQIKLLGLRSKGSTFIDWISLSSSLMVTSFPNHIWGWLAALCHMWPHCCLCLLELLEGRCPHIVLIMPSISVSSRWQYCGAFCTSELLKIFSKHFPEAKLDPYSNFIARVK